MAPQILPCDFGKNNRLIILILCGMLAVILSVSAYAGTQAAAAVSAAQKNEVRIAVMEQRLANIEPLLQEMRSDLKALRERKP